MLPLLLFVRNERCVTKVGSRAVKPKRKEEKRREDSCVLSELQHPARDDLLSAERIIDKRASSAYGATLPQRTG